MKTYEQIAQAMYEAYDDQLPKFKEAWIAAAKEAAKQFGVVLIEDHKGIGDLDDLRIERAYPDHDFT